MASAYTILNRVALLEESKPHEKKIGLSPIANRCTL